MENNSGSLYGRNIGKCHWMDVNFVAYAELLIASSRMAFPSSIWPIHLSICQCGQFPLLLAHPIPPLIGTFVSSLIQPIFAHFILICTFFRHPTFKLILPRFTFNHFHNLLKIENGGKIVLSFLVLVIGVIGGLFAVIGAVYVWKLWQISRVKRRRRHGSSRRHSSFFIPSPHQIWLAKNAQQNSHQQKPNQQTSSLNPTILFVPPGHSQAPLIQHFQRQFSRNVDEEEEKGGGGQTRSLLLELANDTGKLAKMFPKIGPKTTNDETPESGQNIQQKIGGEIENAVEKRRQFSRMSASCQVDENDQIPLASLMMKEKGTQTSPAPMMANKNASIEQPPKSIRRQLPRPKEEDLSQSYFNSIRRHPQQHQRKKHLKQLPSNPWPSAGNSAIAPSNPPLASGAINWPVKWGNQLISKSSGVSSNLFGAQSSSMIARRPGTGPSWPKEKAVEEALAITAVPTRSLAQFGPSRSNPIGTGGRLFAQQRQIHSWDLPNEFESNTNRRRREWMEGHRVERRQHSNSREMLPPQTRNLPHPPANYLRQHSAVSSRHISQQSQNPSSNQKFTKQPIHRPIQRQAHSLDDRPFLASMMKGGMELEFEDKEMNGRKTFGWNEKRNGNEGRKLPMAIMINEFGGGNNQQQGMRCHRPTMPMPTSKSSSSLSFCAGKIPFNPSNSSVQSFSSSSSSSTTLPTMERPRVFSWRTPSRHQQRMTAETRNGGQGSSTVAGGQHFRLDHLDSFALSTPLRRDFAIDHRADSLFRNFIRPDPFELL